MSEAVIGVTVTEAADLTLTTGNTAETVFAANKSRKTFLYCNTSDTIQYVRFHASSAAVVGTGIAVAAGASLLLTGSACPTNRVTAVCGIDNKTYYAVQG